MRVTRSARAGLQFPVGRVHRHLREKVFDIKVKEGAPIYLAAVLEYLTAEVLDIAIQHMRPTKRVRVGPQDIRFALLENDEELRQLAKGVQVASGGFASAGVKALLEEEKEKQKKKKEKNSSNLKLANKKPVLTRKRSLTSIEKAIKKKRQEKEKLKRRKASTTSSSSAPSFSAEADDDALPTFRRRVESSSSAAASVPTFKWQYVDGGWKDYDKDAAEAVEVQYQEYVANPAMCDVRSVKSGRWQYMVDFINMRQTNIEHENHTVRAIRRIDLS